SPRPALEVGSRHAIDSAHRCISWLLRRRERRHTPHQADYRRRLMHCQSPLFYCQSSFCRSVAGATLSNTEDKNGGGARSSRPVLRRSPAVGDCHLLIADITAVVLLSSRRSRAFPITSAVPRTIHAAAAIHRRAGVRLRV